MKRRYRKCLAAVLAGCSLLTSACSPILNQFQPFDVELKRETPEKRETSSPTMQIEEQIQDVIGKKEQEKYDSVEGMDAYYLLPTGVSMPSGLIDFQSLGFMDDKTTCYAYQALYALPDTTGLGGMPMHGSAKTESAKTTENISAKAAHQMVTMLVLYQVETKTYRVLYHSLEDVVVSDIETLDDTKAATRHLRVSKASALPEGKKVTDSLSEEEILALPLCEKMNTQLLGDGTFLFYYDGYGYTFDQNGSLKMGHNLRNYLKNITYAYGPSGYMYGNYGSAELESRPWEKAGDVYTISDIVIDENGYFYIRLSISKKELSIEDENDLLNLDRNMTQLYCRVFSVDIGKNAGQKTETENLFYSPNKNYQNEVDSWMKVNGTVIPFDAKPTEKQIAEEAGTKEQIMQKFPATFDAFTFCRSDFAVRLELEDVQSTEKGAAPVGISVTPKKLTEYLQEVKQAAEIHGGAYAREQYGKKFFVSLPDRPGSETRERYALENAAIPEDPVQKEQEYERTFTIQYTVTETDAEGKEHTRTEQETRTETASFPVRMETAFPEGSTVLYSKETVQDCSLASTAGNGVLEYIQTASGAQNNQSTGYKTEIQWKMGKKADNKDSKDRDAMGLSGNVKTASVPDLAKRLLLLPASDSKNASQILVMNGENGIYFSDTSSDTNPWKIHGIPYEELTSQTQSLGADFYYDASRAVYTKKNNTNWIYLASPSEGILKVNADLGDNPGQLQVSAKKAGRVSQISPYPCYGIRISESGTTCQAIGFPTNAYTYNESDLFRAKVYTVSLENTDAQLNQLSFVFDRNTPLKRTFWKEVLARADADAKVPAFQKVLENLALGESSATRNYQNYLLREIDTKMESRREIGRLAGLLNASNQDTFPRYVFEGYHTLLTELKGNPQNAEELLYAMQMAGAALQGENKRTWGTASAAKQAVLEEIQNLAWPDFSAPQNMENELIATYIVSDIKIQRRILNGDDTVWNEIYQNCGIVPTTVTETSGSNTQTLWSVQDYVTYCQKLAKKWRDARAVFLNYLGLDQTFFSDLLEEDLSMKEETCTTGTSVEALILSLCRQWSKDPEIEGKTDYELAKYLREKQGCSRDTWNQKLDEIATGLQLNYTRSGYEQRGTYEVQKAARQMEMDWKDAQQGEKQVSSAGIRVLESFRSTGSTEEQQKAWKLFLISAGLENGSGEIQLESYRNYLQKEVSDREQVTGILMQIAGKKLPETTDLEQRYDQCQTTADIEALLASIYVERPEIKQLYTGKNLDTPTIEEMAAKMQEENHFTKTQWQEQMETLLAQITIEVSYDAFAAYQKTQQES